MTYIISKDVPLPPTTRRNTASEERLAVRNLAIGESFEFPMELAKTFRNMVQQERYTNPERRYALRKVSDTHHRIWRIANVTEAKMK